MCGRLGGVPSARCTSLSAIIVCMGSMIGCEWLDAEDGVASSSRASELSREPGFSCRWFTDETGDSHGYTIFVPHSFRPGQKPPVLMFLNGRGENGETGISIGNNLGLQIWEMQDDFPFLLVAVQCRTNGSWSVGSPDVAWALEILESVIQEFGADEDRVYLTGVSSGGSGVWEIGSAHAERFAALVPLCGGGGDAERLADARMPVWNFYNDGDAIGLVDSNREMRARLIEHGLSPLVTEYHASGHDCWNRAYRTTAMYGWLLDQSRSRNSTARLFESLPSARLLREWTQQGVGDWTIEDDGILLGRGSDSGGPGLLVSDRASHEVEIHGDAWLDAETVCRIALLSGEVPEAARGLWLSVMLPERGAGGVVRPDGEWIAQLDPAAQRALRPESWNDVRVRLAKGRLAVRLNGWPAVDVEAPTGTKADETYRCALATPDDASDVRWRFVRTRLVTE